MERMFLKIGVLLVVVGGINWLLNRAFYSEALPAVWGSEEIFKKEDHLVTNTGHYNTLFIGSSKTHYQLNPSVFDSVVNAETNLGIHSYNFGIDGMLPPESFHIYRELLKNETLKLKTIIFELDFIKTNTTEDLFTWRGYYWVTGDTYRQFADPLFDSHSSLAFKTRNLGILNIRAFENSYNLGKFNEFISYQKSLRVTDSIAAQQAGFEALIHPASFTPLQTTAMDRIKQASTAAFSDFENLSSAKPNEAYLKNIRALITLSQQKGIHLILLLPAQWDLLQYRELLPILKTIPAKDKIIMASCKDYPQFFDAANMFDEAHLDGKAAGLYSTAVAQQFVKINQ